MPLAVSAAHLEHIDSRQEEREARFYRLETIDIPTNIVLEVGGMDFMPDGRLMICTRRGEIWSLRDGNWKRFASGLDEPMGLCVTASNQIVVAQRPELTRISDTDGDGEADLFETLTDAWNYSGHLYEWNFGPVRDAQGNLFGTLACWFFSSKHYDKPPYSGWEIPPPSGWTPGPNTAWRGWSYKLTPRGEFVPWSSGLRSPNGIGFNLEGELFATDNQGEYYGACVLNHLTKDAFHGHANALFWGPDGTNDAFGIPIEELARRRKPSAIYFPYRAMGQSASQPLCDATAGKFGPFAGQIFVGDQTISTVMRVALEKVDGQYQGACFPFRMGFQSGNNRLVFAADGSLLIGQTDRGWPAIGGRPFGLQRLTWSGEVPFEIHSVKLTRDGFDLNFTKPVDPAIASDANAFSVQSYFYEYHRTYGSPQMEIKPVPATEIRISADARTVSLKLAELVKERIYELNLRNFKAADGSDLLHPAAYYTLNRTLQ